MKTINQLPVYVCQSNCPFLPFSKETMQMKMIACHPRLILQKKMQPLDVIFLCYHKKTMLHLKEGEKNIMCYFPRARVQLYNHAPEAFLVELCFQFHS